LGAIARLQQLDQERRAIFAAFPDLRRGAAQPTQSADAGPARGRRRRRRLSAEARKRMSAGMKRYWAKRKAAGQKG
jgi:hypothetical protein